MASVCAHRCVYLDWAHRADPCFIPFELWTAAVRPRASNRLRGSWNNNRKRGLHSGDRTLPDTTLKYACPVENFPRFKRRSGGLYSSVAPGGNIPSAYSNRMRLRDAGLDKDCTSIRVLTIKLHNRHRARNDRRNFSRHRPTGRTRQDLASSLCDVVIGRDSCERTHARGYTACWYRRRDICGSSADLWRNNR